MMKIQRKLIAILTLSLFLIGSGVFASFPVKTQNNVKVADEKVLINKSNILEKSQAQLNSVTKSDILKANTPASDNDLLITLLLWFFLGGLAGHRWYKKKPVGMNILFILTAGGCGIWLIIDLINIITGKF